MYSTRIGNKVYDEEYIRFAKPSEIGMTKKCFQNTTLTPTEMSFDFLYTPPSGTVNIPQKIEKVEEGIIPIGDRGLVQPVRGHLFSSFQEAPKTYI